MPENPDTVQFTDAPTETDMVAILDELCADNDWREDWANVREAYEHALRL